MKALPLRRPHAATTMPIVLADKQQREALGDSLTKIVKVCDADPLRH